jgi:hypothetical protein
MGDSLAERPGGVAGARSGHVSRDANDAMTADGIAPGIRFASLDDPGQDTIGRY